MPGGDESSTLVAAGASEQARRKQSSRIPYMSFPRWHAGVPQAHATRKCGLRGNPRGDDPQERPMGAMALPVSGIAPMGRSYESRSEAQTSDLPSIKRISSSVLFLTSKHNRTQPHR